MKVTREDREGESPHHTQTQTAIKTWEVEQFKEIDLIQYSYKI